jgi:hypothetical protein
MISYSTVTSHLGYLGVAVDQNQGSFPLTDYNSLSNLLVGHELKNVNNGVP